MPSGPRIFVPPPLVFIAAYAAGVGIHSLYPVATTTAADGVVGVLAPVVFLAGVGLTLTGLLLLRVPYAFALSALATVLYVVPLFGTILSSVPIVLLALGAGGLPLGLAALGWILLIHGLETHVLNPKILGEASRIHPVLIILALVLGESQVPSRGDG